MLLLQRIVDDLARDETWEGLRASMTEAAMLDGRCSTRNHDKGGDSGHPRE